MQRNSGAVSEAELFQVIAAEERVFSENFIQHQLNILKAYWKSERSQQS
jgi:hypothetical protein